jgi:HSP20 family protein
MPIMKHDPTLPTSRDVNRMRNRLQRFFEEPFGFDLRLPLLDEKRMERMLWTPAVEATETPTEYLLTAELPGISPEDVEVAMAEGTLTLRGKKLEEKKEEKKDQTFHLWERSYGEFERTFRFPDAVNEEKVAAEFKNGILTIKIPKVEVVRPAVRTVPIAKK